MLNKNNHNDSDCAFAEQVVSYIYDEVAAGERAAFDAHLANCAACSDEIAGFNLARFSILEWKRQEFSSLQTPTIEIPFDKIGRQNEAISVSEKAQSWLFDFGKIFKQSSAWAGAFALVLVFFGLFLFVYKYNKNDETASGKNQNSPTANVSSIAGNNLNEEVVTPISSDNKETAAKVSLQEATKKRVVRIPNDSANLRSKTEIAEQNSKSVAPARKIYNSNFVAKATVPASIRKIPKLSQIVEDEEEADLRLTDLLEAVGGK
ncbi:MAG: zf-HC2 domain-containing protein [Acidobacteriota bacterium]|nr:zf-HC2 domain-containing protein [Acidobacteriota bacterium]